ncbi:MAG TPA: tetratricopeptide repeat protein [Rhodospirillales bacterium]|nr:tetratricopeptide repeat protein [Rhodospirillales bacterium]
MKPGMEQELLNTRETAVNHHRVGRLAEAELLYQQILNLRPNNADVLHLLGLVAYQSNRLEQAIGLIAKALQLEPGNTKFLTNMGSVYSAQAHVDEAIGCYTRALEIDPKYADAHYNLGNALKDQGRLDEAIACYRRSLEIECRSADALYNLGMALSKRGVLDEAIVCYRHVLEIDPHFMDALTNLGIALKGQGKLDEAIGCYRQALQTDPQSAVAETNLGNAFSYLDRRAEAIACYRRALEIDPGFAEGHFNLASALKEQGNLAEAIDHCRHALDINPNYATAAASLLHFLQHACAWNDFKKLEAKVDAWIDMAIESGEKSVENPYFLTTRCTDPERNFKVCRSWGADIGKRMASLNLCFDLEQNRGPNTKITLGYLSSDFRNHSVGHLIAGLFGCHDRDAFQVIAYSHGHDDGSSYRQRIEQGCDSFVDISQFDDAQAAQRIFEDRVDILVDLNGHTTGNRLQIPALRPAPLQIAYLGFAGGNGTDFFDYIITDRTVTPPEQAEFYSEAFIYMPYYYLVHDREEISPKAITRADEGLPEDAFVFCSFNNAHKIEPLAFAVWMNLLNALPDSVLWLLESNPLAKANLIEAAAKGVNAERLVFAAKRKKDEHLARLRLADLALDTFIFNGGVTTSDALWAGVPVVAMLGSHSPSRGSASKLKAIGLAELIAGDIEAYQAKALYIARLPGHLRALKDKLAGNRLSEPLFDTPRFVASLEKAYQRIWHIHRQGEAPRQIEVAED